MLRGLFAAALLLGIAEPAFAQSADTTATPAPPRPRPTATAPT